jgi:surface antigen
LAIIIQELSPKSTFLVRTRLTSVKAAADHSSFKGTDMTSWSAAMSSRVGPIVLVLTSLLSAPGQAQLLLGPVWESNITLTQDDLDLIHRTVDTQIHGKPVGTTASWSNPNTGNAGTIELLRKFRKGNLQCEEVAYTLTTTKKAVEPEHYAFNSCLTPEGWKIARSSDKYECGAF